MKKILLHNATVVNDGRTFLGYIIVESDRIAEVGKGEFPASSLEKYRFDEVEDLGGKYLLPGVIDDQVHFRDPGLTHKGDIYSESRAAAAGGVTSFMDMPNTKPPTTDLAAWQAKMDRAAEASVVNYSFFFGATNDNGDILQQLNRSRIPGIKVFLGSSTGNLLVDNSEALRNIFSSGMLIAVHSESESIIRENSARYREMYGDKEIPVNCHCKIRSREACIESTKKAISLAEKYNARLHLLHLSTSEEASMLAQKSLDSKHITGEACVHHLWFSDEDYERKGSLIKCNPAIKSKADREALRNALRDGRIDIVATDHAPHLLKEKEGGALKAASGCPLVQYSLPAMIELAAGGEWRIEDVVRWMCHNPARLYGIKDRGFIRPGMKADLAIVDPDKPTEVTKESTLSRCGWPPFEGHTFPASVAATYVNGIKIWDGNRIIPDTIPSQPLEFSV